MAKTQDEFDRRYQEATEQYPEPFPDLVAVSPPEDWAQATDLLTWDEAIVVSEMEVEMMAANLAWQAHCEDMAGHETEREMAAAFERWANQGIGKW